MVNLTKLGTWSGFVFALSPLILLVALSRSAVRSETRVRRNTFLSACSQEQHPTLDAWTMWDPKIHPVNHLRLLFATNRYIWIDRDTIIKHVNIVRCNIGDEPPSLSLYFKHLYKSNTPLVPVVENGAVHWPWMDKRCS